MKKILIVMLASALCVGHESEIDLELLSDWAHADSRTGSLSGDFSRMRSGDSSSLKAWILVVGAYALADYCEKVPNALSVRHAISLMRGKTEQEPIMQDVFNDFKKEEVVLKEESGWGKTILIGGAVVLVLGVVANSRNRAIKRSHGM